MKLSFGLIVAAVLLVGCARQSDLDAANAKLAAANATIETANAFAFSPRSLVIANSILPRVGADSARYLRSGWRSTLLRR
jgi:hypothetical protein